jgi:hypothetical protein
VILNDVNPISVVTRLILSFIVLAMACGVGTLYVATQVVPLEVHLRASTLHGAPPASLQFWISNLK